MDQTQQFSDTNFAVVSVMREPFYVVDAFVRHYIALGATEIFVLWDGVPETKLKGQLDALAADSALHLFYCDDFFWSEKGLNKGSMTLDELLNAGFEFAYEHCTTDWVLICDSDEFLHAPRSTVTLLSEVPQSVQSIRIKNLEAVWGPEDDIRQPLGCTYFRSPIHIRPFTRVLCRLTLGRYAVFSRGGLMGHYSGKHFLRTNIENVTITTHQSHVNGHRIGVWVHELPISSDGFFLAHFDAVSEERWIEKWRRRISKERPSHEMDLRRRRQQTAVENAISNGTTHLMFSRLYGLTWLQTFVLRRLGLLTRATPLQGAIFSN